MLTVVLTGTVTELVLAMKAKLRDIFTAATPRKWSLMIKIRFHAKQ